MGSVVRTSFENVEISARTDESLTFSRAIAFLSRCVGGSLESLESLESLGSAVA
jgi:hypothetical protein